MTYNAHTLAVVRRLTHRKVHDHVHENAQILF